MVPQRSSNTIKMMATVKKDLTLMLEYAFSLGASVFSFVRIVNASLCVVV
jgi:hypothetical protein